jgi:hydroxymethylpyrimidine/phosphomethylpyrimidine kinase
MMKPARPYVLTIGGFDPTGGAGVLADIKTAERLRCYGMSVLTANTVQREDKVLSVNWLSNAFIKEQCDALKQVDFKAIKIGIVQNVEMLSAILEMTAEYWPKATLIWDPIVKASDNTTFFDFESNFDFTSILSKVDIITPNSNELSYLSKKENIEERLSELSKSTQVYLTGGHNEERIGVDYFADKKGTKKLNPKVGTYSEKHGSGCVLSTALACNIALDFPMHLVLLKSKRYIEKVLGSNKTLLAYHYQ